MVELSISYLDQTLMTTFRMDLHSFSMLIESNTPNTGYLQMNGAVSKVNKKWCVFSKPCTKLTLHCNHRSGHLKTEHTERLFLLRRHLGNWPSSPAVSTSERTVGSAWETWTVAAADGVRFARVRWEINFLLTFETAPFICKHTVFPLWVQYWAFPAVNLQVLSALLVQSPFSSHESTLQYENGTFHSTAGSSYSTTCIINRVTHNVLHTTTPSQFLINHPTASCHVT